MDAAVVAFVVVLYTNVAVLGGRMIGSPVVGGAILAAVAIALIAIPVLFEILVRRRGLVLDKPLLLMLGFLGTLCISTFIARDPRTAGAWLATYLVEGLLVYFLVINAVRSLRTLRRTVWGLLVAAALLASLGAYQEIAHDYSHQFGGLAQRDLTLGLGHEVESNGKLIPTRERVGIANRAAGPIADPNRWAQLLLVILPLAVLRVRDEKSKKLRFAATVCTMLILGGIFLTYSRGGVLALAIVVLCMLGFKTLRWRHVVPAALVGGVLAIIIAPGVLNRLQTVADVPGLLSDRTVSQSDGAVRGRLTEMLAACTSSSITRCSVSAPDTFPPTTAWITCRIPTSRSGASTGRDMRTASTWSWPPKPACSVSRSSPRSWCWCCGVWRRCAAGRS
jgi:hypothetical protein